MALSFENINTDYMSFRERESFTHQKNNLPNLQGKLVDVREYRSEFLQGFRSVYNSLRAAKNSQSFTQIIDAVQESEWRKVIRPTRAYALMLQNINALDALRKFQDLVDVETEVRGALRRANRAYSNGTIAIEARSLAGGDIPRFSISGASRHIWTSDKSSAIISEQLKVTPAENIRQRIGMLSDDHRRRMERSIRRRLLSHVRALHSVGQ